MHSLQRRLRRVIPFMAIIFWLVLLALRCSLVPLQDDESFTWRAIGLPFQKMLWAVAADGTPPLHYVALWIWSRFFGDSALVLRSFSVLCDLLSILLAYHLLEQVDQRNTDISRGHVYLSRGVLGALFIALAANVVVQATTFRFYGLAFLLTVASQWALLRALDNRGTWLAWGGLLGLSVLAHPFCGFNGIAQTLYVGIRWLAPHRGGASTRSQIGIGLMSGVGASLAVYSLWLPIVLIQARDVHASFWIPDINVHWIVSMLAFLTFSAGAGVPLEAAWCLIALGGGIVGHRAYAVYKRCDGMIGIRALTVLSSADSFFLLQFAIPFFGAVLLVYLSGRTLFQERYFVMCQAGWLCFLACYFASLRMRMAMRLAVFAVCVFSATAAIDDYDHVRRQSRGLEESLQYLYQEGTPRDVVITESAWDLNVCRYYFQQWGDDGPHVVIDEPSGLSSTKRGHQGHIWSLSEADILPPDEVANAGRVFRWSRFGGGGSNELAREQSSIRKVTFGQANGGGYMAEEFVSKR